MSERSSLITAIFLLPTELDKPHKANIFLDDSIKLLFSTFLSYRLLYASLLSELSFLSGQRTVAVFGGKSGKLAKKFAGKPGAFDVKDLGSRSSNEHEQRTLAKIERSLQPSENRGGWKSRRISAGGCGWGQRATEQIRSLSESFATAKKWQPIRKARPVDSLNVKFKRSSLSLSRSPFSTS